MNEETTSVPDKSSRPRALATRKRQLGLAAVLALAVAAGIATWVVIGRGDSSSGTTRVVPVRPVALSASGLKTLAVAVHQPIYWAGPRRNYLYELKRTANGNVYIRYLPPGISAGAAGNDYLVVATYPYDGAYDALERAANGQGIRVPGGGLALVDSKTPRSVHLAFPQVDYQVEVLDPSPSRALQLATSGQIRPAQSS